MNMKNRRTLNALIREAFGDPIGSYAGQSMIGVRDEFPRDCGCGMTANECECNSSSIEFEQGDYCPICNSIAESIKKICTCGWINEDAGVSYADAKTKFYPKGDENVKKVSKNMEKIPGNEITGASIGNRIEGKPNQKTKPKKVDVKMSDPPKIPEI